MSLSWRKLSANFAFGPTLGTHTCHHLLQVGVASCTLGQVVSVCTGLGISAPAILQWPHSYEQGFRNYFCPISPRDSRWDRSPISMAPVKRSRRCCVLFGGGLEMMIFPSWSRLRMTSSILPKIPRTVSTMGRFVSPPSARTVIGGKVPAWGHDISDFLNHVHIRHIHISGSVGIRVSRIISS